MFLQGTNATEVFDFFRFGHSVRFVHDPGAEAVDLEDVEELDAMAFGGPDVFGVRDLSGTGVDLIDLNLAATSAPPAATARRIRSTWPAPTATTTSRSPARSSSAAP